MIRKFYTGKDGNTYGWEVDDYSCNHITNETTDYGEYFTVALSPDDWEEAKKCLDTAIDKLQIYKEGYFDGMQAASEKPEYPDEYVDFSSSNQDFRCKLDGSDMKWCSTNLGWMYSFCEDVTVAYKKGLEIGSKYRV